MHPSLTDIARALRDIRCTMSGCDALRDPGDPDFDLQSRLRDTALRYACGRCLDFAVGTASETGLVPFALYSRRDAGTGLVHAFLVNPVAIMANGRLRSGAVCLDVCGAWTVSELRELYAATHQGPFTVRQANTAKFLADMGLAPEGAYDRAEVVLSVAGCLPHFASLIPDAYLEADPGAALDRLDAIGESRWLDPFPGKSAAQP